MARSDQPNKLWALAKLVFAVGVAGGLVAGFLLPYVAGVGLAARSGAEVMEDIPIDFEEQPPPTITKVLAYDGSLITNLYNYYRVPVTIDAVPKLLQDAVIAIEDSRFWSHHGIDTTGTLRAVIENMVKGEIQQGGSTLTQQLVKNTLYYQAVDSSGRAEAVDPTIGRKLREAKIALELEKRYSKEQILEKYLNLMNYGGGAYGLAAAANIYFSVPADKLDTLTLPQMALIAGMVQNPTGYNPFNYPDRTKVRRDSVLTAMAKDGYITQAQAAEAKKVPIAATLKRGTPPPQECSQAAAYGGFFCNYVLEYLQNTLKIPSKVLREGGLTIKTTFNPWAQVVATTAIVSQEPYQMGDPRAAVLDIVEPGTGKVRVLAVNRIFGTGPGQTMDNLPIKPAAGAGSTYKVFVAAAAIERMMSIYFTLNAPSPYQSTIRPDAPPIHNAGNYPPVMQLDAALYESSNTYFVALQDALGSVEPGVTMAKRMGLWSDPDHDPIPNDAIAEERTSFTLGPTATSPLRLAVAYATLAANGTRCEPIPLEDVLTADLTPLVNPETKQPYFTTGQTYCTPNAIPPGVASTINQILLKDITLGTGRSANLGDGRDIAGKTGTAQEHKSYAFVGYTPYTVGSVMAFWQDGSSAPLPSPAGAAEGFGGGYPALIWRQAMATLLAGVDPVPFPPADPVYENGNTFAIPVDCTGRAPAECKAILDGAGLAGIVAAGQVDSAVPAGLVASTSPPAGSRVVAGQPVYIQVSNGSQAGAPPPCQPGQIPTPELLCA